MAPAIFAGLQGLIYIIEQINYQKQFIMQKGELSTPEPKKSINYFKYEMKDTNQLLKELFFNSAYTAPSQTPSPKHSKSNLLPAIQANIQPDCTKEKVKQKYQLINPKDLLSVDFNHGQQENYHLKFTNENQNSQNCLFRDLQEDHYIETRRNKPQKPFQDLILHKLSVEQGANYKNEKLLNCSFNVDKQKDIEINHIQLFQDHTQLKKQKKGLANISLRVKNIIAEKQKLTYKQVSDMVLQYSKEEIEKLEPPSQRLKEIKNIKRRVYDALNVLVAVGILGKSQRCVCKTQWTKFPGKKLSNEWQKINFKMQQFNKLKKQCQDKEETLNALIKKYNSLIALRNRNSQNSNSQKKETQKQGSEEEKQSECQTSEIESKKLQFPIILFFPSKNYPCQNLNVELKEEENQQIYNQKVKIFGKHIDMMGDFDLTQMLDLQKYRDLEKEEEIIENMQTYVGSQMAQFQVFDEQEYLKQDNIEEYFDDQVFESRND